MLVLSPPKIRIFLPNHWNLNLFEFVLSQFTIYTQTSKYQEHIGRDERNSCFQLKKTVVMWKRVREKIVCCVGSVGYILKKKCFSSLFQYISLYYKCFNAKFHAPRLSGSTLKVCVGVVLVQQGQEKHVFISIIFTQ